MDGLLKGHGLIAFFVVVVVAGAIGFGAGNAVQGSEAANDSIPKDLYVWTYSDSLCSAGNKKDPINVLFIQHGLAPYITTQAISHGGWATQGETEQYFGDQNGCKVMDGSPASNCCNTGGRYHMRHYNHKGPNGGIRTVPPWGSLSSAAAHHEEAHVWPFGHPDCTNPFNLEGYGHAVDENETSFTIGGQLVLGGFNAGREDIRKNWVLNGDHVVETFFYWDNTALREQCDHGFASSSGKVYYITTFEPDPDDTDGDGCDDIYENGPDHTKGGQRNPLDPWDYYDVSLPTDGAIDLLNDILGVISHHQPADGGAPPYDAYYDRGPSAGNLWTRTAPDGVIDLLNDILGVIQQYNPFGCRF